MNFIERLRKNSEGRKISDRVSKRFVVLYKLLILTLVLAGIIFSWVSIIKENNKIEERMIAHAKILNNIIKNEISQIELKLSYASSKITKISRSYYQIDALLSSLSSNFNSISNQHSASWNAYSWVNKHDKIVVDGVFGIIRDRPDVSNRDYLRFTKFTKNNIVVGESVYGILSKRHVIPIAVGVFSDYSDAYLGTLVFGLDIDKIRDKLETEINDDNAGFLIFKEDKVLISSQNLDRSVIQNISEKVRILSLEDGKVEKRLTSQGLFFGDNYISAFKKDEKSPIGVAIIYDHRSYRDQMTKIIMENMLVVALLALLFFILFKVLYIRIIQPVSNLSSYLKQIAGKNFNIELQKHSNRELNEIYDSLELIRQLFSKEESTKKQMIEINKKLSKENISKNQFFQAVCQDLRSPIFAISNEIKSLAQTIKNKKDQEMIDNINENIEDILLLTEDLLDISRNSTGSINIDRNSLVDISKIIDKSIKICSNFAKKNSVTIKNCVDQKESKKIKLDKKRVRQILVSLLIRMTLSSKKGGLIKVNIEDFISEGKEKLRIFIKSDSDCTSLEEADPFNVDLKNIKDLVHMMGGKFQIEKKIDEWCVIKITFGN